MIRRTKIICTIGPATTSFEALKQLYEAGMNVVRLNMSHADHATSKKIINWVKTLNRQIPYPIPILLDTQRSRDTHRRFSQSDGVKDRRRGHTKRA